MDTDITMDDITVESIVDMVFNNPIEHSKRYSFTFPDYNLKEIYEELLSIFAEGMKKLFSNDGGGVCIRDLSENDLKTINKYFHSFGINIIVEIYTLVEYLEKHIISYNNYMVTSNTKLNELKVAFNVDNMFYVISFDFIV